MYQIAGLEHILGVLVMLAINFECHLVSSGCLRLLPAAPDALTHLIVSVSLFRGLWFLVRRRNCPQVKCERSLFSFFFSYFLFLLNFDNFLPLQHPKVEV